MIKRGPEQRDSMNEYLFDSDRWVEIQINTAQSNVAESGGGQTAAEDAVLQSAQFNRSEVSDRNYAARVANMQLAISRVRQSWQ